MKKRFLALLLCVVLVMTSVCAVYAAQPDNAKDDEIIETITSAYEDDDPEVFEFKKVASNDRFELGYDEGTSFICLNDLKTNQKWYSNPPIARRSDPYASGDAVTKLRAVLGIRYTNTAMQEKDTNSGQASVKYAMSTVDNGIRVDYTFSEQKFFIPVQYTLTEDGMIAEILYSEIKQEGVNVLNKIDFLTYFGAAVGPDPVDTKKTGDDGYLVIPDGAGAIVNFNNQKNVNTLIYDKPIYGKDHSHTTDTDIESSRSEKISLPVFGMVRNGYGMLAEVTSGAETASIKAATSGNKLIGNYNVVHTNATYRVNYSLPLMGQVSSETSNAMYNAEDPVSMKSYAVQYHFTDNTVKLDKNKKPVEGAVDYTDLAELYRGILEERAWLTADKIEAAFYAELYGAVTKKKSFVGILYDARETLTSFEQAQAMLQDLKDGGVDNIQTQYVNFTDDFFNKDMEIKLNPSGSLGGKKGWTSLQEYASANNTQLSASADFVTFGSGGNGYSTFWDVANAINISPIEVFPVSLNGNTFNTTKHPYYLVDPQKYDKAIDTLIDSASKLGYTSLYFDDEAVQLYSDLSPKGFQSERTSGAQMAAFKRLADAGLELTLSEPNAYLFAVADQMVDIPVCSSKELIFDEEIPFLQTVLRGYKNFAGESMNITDVSDESFLRHLEYGTNIRYALTDAGSESLLNTDHTFLYSATYSNFSDQIKARYKTIKEFDAAVQDAKIVNHVREGNVAVTTYSNGTTVYVNYNDEAVESDGATVEAMNYLIVEGVEGEAKN